MGNGLGGPKTQLGKEVSSRNALRHGLRSTLQVIPFLEEESDWSALRDGLFADYQPQTTVEAELVEHLASDFWMLRRIRRARNAEIHHNLYELPSGLEPTKRLRGEPIHGDTEEKQVRFQREADRRLVFGEFTVDKFARLESHTLRQIQKTSAEIRALQKPASSKHPVTPGSKSANRRAQNQ